MSGLLLLLVVSAAPPAEVVSPRDQRVGVAVLAFSGVGVSDAELNFESEHLAASLRAPGLNVITSREMATVLGMERERRLVGCDGKAGGCVAEIAAALGTEVIIVGDVGRFGANHQINVKALSGRDAHLLAAKSLRVSDAAGELDALSEIGRSLAEALLEQFHLAPPPALETVERSHAQPSLARWTPLPLSITVAAGIAGGVLMALAHQDAAALTGTGASPLQAAEANALRDAGKAKQLSGAALLVLSGASLVAAAALFASDRPPALFSAGPMAGGWGVAVTGRLP